MLAKYLIKNKVEAGCDEAGRGCLAGPVFAAAVILTNTKELHELNDSKQLTEKQRDRLCPHIKQNSIWSVAMVSPSEIDEINILNASILAMHRALEQLSKQPEHIIIDGNRFKPYLDIPYKTIIKGDGKYLSIAAASILAKTHRDAYMQELHLKFPDYGWNKNKGYPTMQHRKAIRSVGACQHHRKSFTLLNNQLTLF